MKTLVAVALLICFLRHSSAAPAAPSAPKDGCCQGHNQTRIPKGWVRHVGTTPADCQSKAIVITTVCGKKFCVDPEWKWAKNLLSEFKKSSANFNLQKCSKKF